jgi:hypothetical protein
MKLWLSWSAEKRQQYILNMQPYYEKMGWLGGPHFFVPPQDDICAFGFNNLMSAGTHASCFNKVSIGIEGRPTIPQSMHVDRSFPHCTKSLVVS